VLLVCEEANEAEDADVDCEGDGRFRMRSEGWNAAGGGGSTVRPVLEGEMISSGMEALLLLVAVPVVMDENYEISTPDWSVGGASKERLVDSRFFPNLKLDPVLFFFVLFIPVIANDSRL
jgi:hypothetical protein